MSHAAKGWGGRAIGLALGLGFGTAGCSLAPLDTSGTIVAGPDGSANACPDGYVSRWGRCCPANAPASECPASLARDTSGALYPPIDNTCPHDYELRFGKCCPADAGAECPPGEIGAPCTSNDQCRRPAGANLNLSPFCMTPASFAQLPFQAPDGYCSVNNCDTDADCGPGASCLKYFTLKICVRSCEAAGDGGAPSCPGTGNQLACMTYYPAFAQAPYHFCFPDCTLANPSTRPADAGAPGDGGATDGGDASVVTGPWVCQGEWQCFSDIHQCAHPCGSVNDNLMCQFQSQAQYQRCDPDARHCAY